MPTFHYHTSMSGTTLLYTISIYVFPLFYLFAAFFNDVVNNSDDKLVIIESMDGSEYLIRKG
jgi:hypothetical protein